MEKANRIEADLFSFPSREEIEAAQRACCGRICSACEMPAGYAWRKRSVDLAALVRRAAREELTETERRILLDYWFRNRGVNEIAQAMGVTHAAVSRKLKRATARVEHVLSYAVQYQLDCKSAAPVPLAVRRAAMIAAVQAEPALTLGSRLRQLRLREGISAAQLGELLMLPMRRVFALEQDAAQPTAQELLHYAAFFSVTADWILKGEDQNEYNVSV